MDHFNAYAKSSTFASLTPSPNHERPSAATYGDGCVYTGPLTTQYYAAQSKSSTDLSKHSTNHADNQQHGARSASPTMNNLPLSTSPSTEVVSSAGNNTSNQYQFKVMLLGDSGVGKCAVGLAHASAHGVLTF